MCFGQQDGVRAQIDELLARHDAGDDLRHLLVDQRLAAGDRDHRRAALIHRAQRVRDAHPLLQDLLRIIDLAAAGAGQIALEQRLQHQHQRITLLAAQFAAGDVAADTIRLNQRNTPKLLTPYLRARHAPRGDPARSAPTRV